MIDDSASVVVENHACVSFHLGSYRKEMVQRCSIINDEDIMCVDGVKFWEPTKTTEEMDTSGFCNHPKKRNYLEMFNHGSFTSPTQLLPENNYTGIYIHTTYILYIFAYIYIAFMHFCLHSYIVFLHFCISFYICFMHVCKVFICFVYMFYILL